MHLTILFNMNSGVYCLLTLALLMNIGISYQLGHDKKVKMNVMLNTTEDGFVKASLYITNATSTMLNNASLIVSMEALLAENNTVIGAVGYMRDSRVNGSVNFSSIEEMENVEKLNRCLSLMEEEVEKLQLANEEFTKKFAFLEAVIQTFSIFKSKVSEEVRELQLAIEGMKRKLSSQEDEKQRSFSLKVSLLEKRGYQFISGMGFYKFHSKAADFQNAVRICESEGGHLGVIDSEKEAEEFSKLTRKNGYASIWVGIHDPHKRRSFQSILGTPLNALGFRKWGSGEPDNWGGNQYCVDFRGDGLNDYRCDAKDEFICEIET